MSNATQNAGQSPVNLTPNRDERIAAIRRDSIMGAFSALIVGCAETSNAAEDYQTLAVTLRLAKVRAAYHAADAKADKALAKASK